MAAAEALLYRERGPEDFGEAAALIERVFREEFDMPVGEPLGRETEALRRRFDARRDLVLTTEVSGSLVGTLLVSHEEEPNGTAFIPWLVVDAPHRGKGIGRELLFRGVESCREKRYLRLRARAFALSPAAPHLLWMHGFRVAELKPLWLGGRPRETILFEKWLTPSAA